MILMMMMMMMMMMIVVMVMIFMMSYIFFLPITSPTFVQPPQVITPHPRFQAFVANIRHRKGAKAMEKERIPNRCSLDDDDDDVFIYIYR